jgi:hypothetical protein
MKKVLFSIITLIVIVTSNKAQEVKYIAESKVNDTIAHGATLYKISDSVSYVYTRPTPFKYIKYAAKDLYEGPKMLFKKESVWPIVGVTAGTLVLIGFDEQITSTVRQFCGYIGLPGTNNAKNISPIKNVPFWVPTDLSSGLYYIGDGITEMAVNGSFYIYGLIKKDNRALRTASQLSEGLISVGIVVQLLKHVAGRTTAYANDGKDLWRPCPNPFTEYGKHVPQYDAFPSGHLAIGMTTVTIIAMNYPEKKYIRPVGYTLLGLCGFQMINNGVHWAGDYPLAILMGYSFGKLIVNRDRLRVKQKDIYQLTGYRVNHPKLKLNPTYLFNFTPGLRLSLSL